MVRIFAGMFTVMAVILFCSGSADAGKAVKAQMVKGTIKSFDPDTNVLVVSQKVKNENVDRQLSITEDVEFKITLKSGDTKTVAGRSALIMLEREKAVGAMVQVKCDKDVNVLSVKVTIK